jgi:hypothetical protein
MLALILAVSTAGQYVVEVAPEEPSRGPTGYVVQVAPGEVTRIEAAIAEAESRAREAELRDIRAHATRAELAVRRLRAELEAPGPGWR